MYIWTLGASKMIPSELNGRPLIGGISVVFPTLEDLHERQRHLDCPVSQLLRARSLAHLVRSST